MKELKLKQFDLSFVCDNGKFDVFKCTRFPSVEELESNLNNLFRLGLGHVKKIEIKNIDMEMAK